MSQGTLVRGLLIKAGLRFQDPHIEARFQQHYASRVYVILQAAIFLSIATYELFGLADITRQSGGVQSTRFRFMIAVPLLATLFGLSFLGIVRRCWQVGAILFGTRRW